MNTEIKTKIETAIGNGDIPSAINILLHDWKRNPFNRVNALMISFRFKALERSRNKGTISDAEFNTERNKIAESILRLVDTKQAKSYRGTLLFSAAVVVLVVLFFLLKMCKKDQVQYCLVAQSFSLYSNAESYLATIKENAYPNASITISKNNNYYVCFDILSDKKEAIYRLERLKVIEGNHKLWIDAIR